MSAPPDEFKPPANPWRTITLEELEKHTNIKGRDAWLAIKGVIYDVSFYAAKHPGGIEKIQKYLGRDATDAFNAVHAYVDIRGILSEYQVGMIKGGHKNAPSRGWLKNGDGGCCLKGDSHTAPLTWFKQDSITATYCVDFQYHAVEDDWTIGVIDKQFLNVFKFIDRKKSWLSVYSLPDTLVNDRAKVDYKNNYKHAEITFKKPIPATFWAAQIHGLREQGRIVPANRGHIKFDGFIIYKKCLTPNIIMFGIQVVGSARINVPTGLHVDIYVNGNCRPYTPVSFHIVEGLLNENNVPIPKPENRLKGHEEHPPTVLYFMIKIYGRGEVTSALDKIPMDMGNEIHTLQISSPYGYFDEKFFRKCKTLLLIAGGSGITPMIKIIRMISEHHSLKRVCLIYFGETIYDLVWRQRFARVAEIKEWFFYFPVVTRPSRLSEWEGLTGRINKEMIQDILTAIHPKGRKKACICGPPGFNAASVNSLTDIIPLEHIYVFAN